MSDRVTISIENHVADVRLTRPDKMNAIDNDMFRAIQEAGRNLRDDPSVRAVVLSGEGRCFSAGLDMSSFAAMAKPRDAAAPADNADSKTERRADGGLLSPVENSPANFAQAPAWVWQEIDVPVIAAVHGVAYGGGLQIALGADIRIVAPDVRMSVLEIKWGLIPDMSATQTLRHLVRLDVAKELTFTGRIVNGAEAVELGLATRVSDRPYEDARELAETIARKSPSAIRAGKSLLNETRGMDVRDGLRMEARLQGGLIGSPNQIESVKSNIEKRAAVYED